MNKSSGSGFIHSIKVPRIYKTASVIVKKVVEEGGSVKTLVYGSGHKVRRITCCSLLCSTSFALLFLIKVLMRQKIWHKISQVISSYYTLFYYFRILRAYML